MLLDGATIAYEATGNFDGVQLFVKNSTELVAGLKVVIPVLKPDTVLWIAYPKKGSGIKTDLEMMGSWDEPSKYGLNTVAAAADRRDLTGFPAFPSQRPIQNCQIGLQ